MISGNFIMNWIVLGYCSWSRSKFCSVTFINPRPGRGGGADFALPSCFSQISNKLIAWFLRAFQYLTRNERRIFWKINRKSVHNFWIWGCKVKICSARTRRCVSGRHAQTSVWIIFRSCKTKRRSETGEAAFESSHQGAPNPCLTF